MVFLRKEIMLRAFRAELSEDLVAGPFFTALSPSQQSAVLNYVERSYDETEAVARSATALARLREGRIDFV